MRKRYLDEESQPIDESCTATVPTCYVEVYDDDDRLVRVERHRNHQLNSVKYPGEGRDEGQLINSHIRHYAGLPFQISYKTMEWVAGPFVETTKFFDGKGVHSETVVFHVGAHGSLVKATYLDTRGAVVKHTRYHYGHDGDLEYEFDYGPDGTFREGYDYLKDDRFIGLGVLSPTIAEDYQSAG